MVGEALLFVILTLASYRLWRIVGLDEWPPSKRLRGEIEVRAHQWGEIAADDASDRHDRIRGWFWNELQTFVECPWCLGAWMSACVVFVVDQWFVSLELPVVWWLAVSCGVGLIGSNLDG